MSIEEISFSENISTLLVGMTIFTADEERTIFTQNAHPDSLFGKAGTENKTRRTISNHTCETTQLLQELNEDSLCLCQLNNSDFVEVINENEPCNVQNNNITSPDKSKQLIIFNEEGCMKGIEVNKEVNSNAASDFVFRFSNDPLQETYILVETDDSSDPLNGKLLEKNIINNYEPMCNGDVTESDSQNVKNLMPPSCSQYAVQTTVKNKRKRGRPRKIQNKKASKGRKAPAINIQNSNHHSVPYTSTLQQSYTQVSVEIDDKKAQKERKAPAMNIQNSNHHSGPYTSTLQQSYTQVSVEIDDKKAQKERKAPAMNIQNSNHHSGPYTSTLQQSYTHVSVEEEEVHVTEAQNPAERPRRTTKNKTASEMLMLKRKIRKRIVESTSIEYQPRKIHTNYVDPGTRMVSRQTAKRQIVRYQEPNKLEKYGPHELPSGWNVKVVMRKSGKTAGNFDVYFITPEGKRLRSRVDLASYIEKNGLPFSADEFCFKKSAYTLPMLENSTV